MFSIRFLQCLHVSPTTWLLPGQAPRAILLYYTVLNGNIPLLYKLCCSFMHDETCSCSGTYCLSVTNYLVLTPSQTQRCQYCFYNALSSQGLILYFTVREKKNHFLHHNVSCFCLAQQPLVSECNLPVP